MGTIRVDKVLSNFVSRNLSKELESDGYVGPRGGGRRSCRRMCTSPSGGGARVLTTQFKKTDWNLAKAISKGTKDPATSSGDELRIREVRVHGPVCMGFS